MIFFSVKESFRSIKRAKLAFLFSLISTSIGLLLIQFSLIVVLISGLIEEKIIESFKMNVYLKEIITPEELINLQITLTSSPYCKNIEYVSKDKAREIFIQQTGNDFKDILEYNPLPASFIITLNENYYAEDSLKIISSLITNNLLIDSFDFQNDFFKEIKSHLNNFKFYIWGITLALLLLAFYLVYSTLRLIIENKKEEITTMKLVGASMMSIKLPIVLNGIILGIVSSIIAFGIVFYLNFTIKNQFDIFTYLTQKNFQAYLYCTLFIGPIMGILISLITLRSISIKIK